jgi:hypothetical protein
MKAFALRRPLAFSVLGAVLVLSACSSGDAQEEAAAAAAAQQTRKSAGPGELKPTGRMATPREGHAASVLPNGTVLISGGMRRDGGDVFSSTEIYNADTGVFVTGPDMESRRAGHTATELSDGRILLTGGVGYLRSAEIYDPAARTFTRVGNMAEGRIGHTATLLDDGRVLIVGGEFRASAEIFDPLTNTFRPTGDMSTARVYHTATLLDDGKVLVTGGHRGRVPDIEVFNTTETFSPLTGKFSAADSMSVARHQHEAVRLPDNRVLVMGGSDKRDRAGRYRSAEIYDPELRAFAPVGDMSARRHKIQGTALVLENGSALIVGGADRVEVFDVRHDSFIQAAGAIGSELTDATATLLIDGRVLIVGGDAKEPDSYANAWVYEP